MVREVGLALVMQRGNVIALDAEIGLALERLRDMRTRLLLLSEHGVAGRDRGEMEMVERGDALHGVDGLGIAPRDEIGAAEVAPEACRMEGVEAHRLADPLDAFLGV